MFKKIVTVFLCTFIGATTVSYAQKTKKEKETTAVRPANFLELAQTRYTTKVYDPTKKISRKKINQLAEILRLTPSSINSQPWQFVFISDEKIKNQLAEASSGSNVTRIKEASDLVVFRGFKNSEKLENQMNGYLHQGSIDFYNTFVKTDEKNVRAWVGHQVYISLGFFLAACADMGIDSTPMEGFSATEYDKILNLGDDYETLFVVAIGYRNPIDGNQPSKKPKDRLPRERVVKFL